MSAGTASRSTKIIVVAATSVIAIWGIIQLKNAHRKKKEDINEMKKEEEDKQTTKTSDDDTTATATATATTSKQEELSSSSAAEKDELKEEEETVLTGNLLRREEALNDDDDESTTKTAVDKIKSYDRRVSSILREDCDHNHGHDEESKESFHDLYDMHEELGRGAFSVVKTGTLKSNPDEKFAIKVITKSELKKFDEKSLHEEISMLRTIKHESIIELYGVYNEAEHFYLITEIVRGGELFERLIVRDSYTEKEARRCCRILMDVVSYCHSKQIAHRDLKPENLLLTSKDDDSSIKVADFGFAKYAPTPTSLQTQCGSPAEVAPEILENKKYGVKCDMWSVGVISYSLIGGYPPFFADDGDQKELFRKIKAGKYEFHEDWWGHVSKDAKDMIARCLVSDPAERASAEEIMECSWMKAEDVKLKRLSLLVNQKKLKETLAKRKFKAAVHSVMATHRLTKFSSLGLDKLDKETKE